MEGRFNTVSPDEAKGMMESAPEGGYLLLDVRQPSEYEAGHMPAARLMPLGELEEQAAGLDRKRKLFVYCRSGNRSRAAGLMLARMGFEQVFNIAGGIKGWPYQALKGFPRVEIFTGAEGLVTAINLAFFMERGAENFYLMAAERAVDPKAKELLRGLARVEEGHMKRLYERLEADRKGEVPSFEEYHELAESELLEGGLRPEDYFYRLEEMAFQDEVHILEMAIELEGVAYDFYRNVAEQAEVGEVRRLLLDIAAQEKVHLKALAERIG